jgi:hypothetical protein
MDEPRVEVQRIGRSAGHGGIHTGNSFDKKN